MCRLVGLEHLENVANDSSGRHMVLTLLLSVNVDLDIRFFEWPPLEVFLVATALNVSSGTLLTSWLLFATLQPLRLAGNASYTDAVSTLVRPYRI